MKKHGTLELGEDRSLAEAVRQAFDAGEVPARLSAAVHAAAGREWLELRRRRRQRMHRWISGLTSLAAALVILTFSATQYFDEPAPGAEEFRHLDRIMDLVSLSYPDEDLTDDELLALDLASDDEVTPDFVAARIYRMAGFDEDDCLAEQGGI